MSYALDWHLGFGATCAEVGFTPEQWPQWEDAGVDVGVDVEVAALCRRADVCLADFLGGD